MFIRLATDVGKLVNTALITKLYITSLLQTNINSLIDGVIQPECNHGQSLGTS